MAAIFISYRRADAAGHAGRLADRLRACFGHDAVFRDYEAIACGDDFQQAIDDALRSCAVLIPVIGPNWTTLTDNSGQRRLDDEGDYVRREIAYALAQGVPLLPVLVDGAAIPQTTQLPDQLAELPTRQMHELREARWDDDVTALMRRVQSHTELVPACPELRAPAPWRDALRNFFHDLLELHGDPVRFQVRYNLGRKQDVQRAATFFVAAVLLGDALLWGSGRWNDRSGVDVLVSIASGVPVWFSGGMLYAVLLWAAWWLTGTRGHFRRMLTNAFYQSGFVTALTLAALAIFATGVGYSRPDFLEGGLTLMLETPPAERSERLMASYGDAVTGPVAFVALILAALILLDVAIWSLRAWRGHRAVLDRRRAQSGIALLLFVALMAGVIGVPVWLGLTAASAA